MSHPVLHLREPFTQLLVLLVEDDPGVEAVGDLLFTQRHLRQKGSRSFVTGLFSESEQN